MSRTKKVVILTSIHPPFDVRIYQHQARTLADEGYEVSLMGTNIHAHKTSEGIFVTGVPQPKGKLGRLFNWLEFFKIALAQKADVYHFHDPDLLLVGLFLQLFSRRPVVYDCHEAYWEVIQEREWVPKLLRPLAGFMYNLLEYLVTRFLAAVVIASPGQQIHLPDAILIRNLPRLENFALPKQANRNPTQLIYLGLLAHERGIEDLIEACRLLLKERDVKIFLVGGVADKKTGSAIDQLIPAYGLDESIKYLGVVTYSEGVELLTQSSIGLIPFRATPALCRAIPVKMFEYMACGLPIVATDLPLTAAVVKEVNCGLIVPPANPCLIAEAIAYLLDHPQEARKMGENGRQAVLERYNWESEAKKLLDLYAFLLT
ncbi:MAG: glycosyltransferase family 4 protein [Anaerolineae bacterium]|nr:glycosyltransferase family 4 protein [Anaerolineae bacterium]